jgi:hypothetical protein
MIICRVEGKDEKSKEKVEKEFFSALLKVSTEKVPRLDLDSDEYIKSARKRLGI